MDSLAWIIGGGSLLVLLLANAWVTKKEMNARGERCGCGCDD